MPCVKVGHEALAITQLCIAVHSGFELEVVRCLSGTVAIWHVHVSRKVAIIKPVPIWVVASTSGPVPILGCYANG